jgi:hypothetical protein
MAGDEKKLPEDNTLTKATVAVGTGIKKTKLALEDLTEGAFSYLKQMHKDFNKIGEAWAAKPVGPPRSKERIEMLEAVHPAERKQMEEILNELDGKKEEPKDK